jgi:hypothetical protein
LFGIYKFARLEDLTATISINDRKVFLGIMYRIVQKLIDVGTIYKGWGKIDSICRLTVCVSGGGAGVDKTSGAGKTRSEENA